MTGRERAEQAAEWWWFDRQLPYSRGALAEAIRALLDAHAAEAVAAERENRCEVCGCDRKHRT